MILQACNTHMAKVTLACKAKGLNVSFLPTEKAISTYNFLVTEDRLVSCAGMVNNSFFLLLSFSDVASNLIFSGPDR